MVTTPDVLDLWRQFASDTRRALAMDALFRELDAAHDRRERIAAEQRERA
jgi:hypothetical protein